MACVEKPDIIAITETWINTKDKDFLTEFEIEGYSVYHKDRIGRKGGGVAVYAKNSLKSYVCSTVKSHDNNETVWVEIINGRDKLLFGNIYRPPNLSREDSTLLFEEMSRASKYKNVCIVGDFNYRNVDWINNIGDHESDNFVNLVHDNFLKQLVNEPTRQNNILDLVLTNRDNLVS